MPILSNQGRTVPELPSISSTNIDNSDLLIIQNLSSNSTKRSSVLDFCTKASSVITKFDNLKFTGINNSFTGSILHYQDAFSNLSVGVPNILRRLKTVNYLQIGENSSESSGLTAYTTNFIIDQTQKSGTTLLINGNGTNSTFTIQNYPSGLNIVNTPVTVENLYANAFIGNLTGNVVGNVNYTGVGQSTFFNLNVDNVLTVAYTTILNADINGGTIDGTVIGNTTPSRITGSKIWAKNGIKGDLTGDVTGNITGNVVGDLIGTVNGNVNGNLSGNVNGNISTVTGTSTFNNVDVNGTLTAANTNLPNVTITGGTINSTIIGNTSAESIRGTVITANTRFLGQLTGSISGSRARFTRLTSSNALVGGKLKVNNGITGNLTGNVEGNVLGDLIGNVLGDVTGNIKTPSNQLVLYSGPGDAKLGRFYGTASYALNNLTSSYAFKAEQVNLAKAAESATNAILAITSRTSSYLLQQSNRKTNALSYYNGTELTDIPVFYQVDNFNNEYRFLKLSSSNKVNYFVIDSTAGPALTPPATNTFCQTHLVLSLNQNRRQRYGYFYNGNSYTQQFGPEYWDFVLNSSGSLFLQSYSASYNFNNTLYKSSVFSGGDGSQPPYGLINPIKYVHNNIYFWPDRYLLNTPSRDGAIGLGVQVTSDSLTAASPLQARFQIDVFSASLNNINRGNWKSTDATVRHFDKAFLIRYGSSSLNTTTPTDNKFYVTSKGGVYAADNVNFARYTTSSFRGVPAWTLNNKNVSFFGTGSHSVSSSFSNKTISSVTSVSSSYSRLIPYYLYRNSACGGRLNGTPTIGEQSYRFPQTDPGATDPRELPLSIPVNKTTRWFKINGTIKNLDENNPTKLYQIFGVRVKDNVTTLDQDKVFCDWGWNNGFRAPYLGILPFTIEGSLEIQGPAQLVLEVLATAGMQMSGYIVVYYDN